MKSEIVRAIVAGKKGRKKADSFGREHLDINGKREKSSLHELFLVEDVVPSATFYLKVMKFCHKQNSLFHTKSLSHQKSG